MNKFEIKTLLSSLSVNFDIIDIIIKKHKNELGEDIDNCFIFFKHNDSVFVIWEKFKTFNSNSPNLEFSEKILSSEISLKNTIDFLDRSIFTTELNTTGNPKKYMIQNIASVLFDQLNCLSQLQLANNKFKSYNVGLNFDLLKENVSKRDLDLNNAFDIYKDILLEYGFDCLNFKIN